MIPDLVVVTVFFHTFVTSAILSAAKDDKGKEFSGRIQRDFREDSGRIQRGFREGQRGFREGSERIQRDFREGREGREGGVR